MTGRLIYLMGSSGAGKDTLLREIASRQLDDIIIAKRHITREVTADEDHFPVSDSEFTRNIDQQRYVMHWFANGYGYGIDNTINSKLAQNKTVIVNGSREYFPLAKQRFPELLAVCLVVDATTLRQRLVIRGRDNDEEIDARLKRNETYQDTLPQDAIFIDNGGAIKDTCDAFLVKTGVITRA